MLVKVLAFICSMFIVSCEVKKEASSLAGVFVIITESGSGTCWALDESHIVTNSHVVGVINLVVIDEKIFEAVLVSYSKDNSVDIAILEVCDLEEPLSALIISKEKLILGEDIWVVGFPSAIGPVLSKGIFGGELMNFMITDCDFSAGSSGSPVFNSEWKVVGIATAYKDCRVGSGFGLIQDIQNLKELVR